MASSLISNSHHIDFESVFRLDDAGMVQMFETLIATGLKEILGCPAVFYEYALTEFFANSSLREDGMVVSTIGDVPKNFVFDARSLFSDSKEQVSMSCLKKALKFHYRLLHDILAKTIYVKAGSFDSVTRDRFLLMTAITFDVKINWSSLLFGVFKEMVTPGSRQEKGYAIQICVLLRNVLGLELGESKSFPVPRILNEKTVHRFVSVNENVGIKEVADAPRARRTPVKKTVSKKRPATGDDEVALVIKKKRSTKGKPVAARRISLDKQVEDATADEEDSVEGTVDKVSHVPVQVAPIMDDVDMIIGQVISESADLSSNNTDQGDKHVDETDIGDDFDKWLDSSFPDFYSRVDEPVVASTNLDKAANSKKSAEEHMSFDDILLQIPNDMLLPSITAAEVTMIRLGKLSSIGDKGKALLVEDEHITENHASEIVALICRDVEVLVWVRDSVMKAVVDFFDSFSLNTMPDMESLKDLKEKEKLMMEWAETNTLATAVRRQMYVLTKYREMLLRTFLESCRRFLELDQPWTDMAIQVFSLLSAAHSQSLEDFKAQQQEHKIDMVQPNSSLPVIDSIDRSGVRLAHFYSIAKSICWVRPMVLIYEVWTPLQGSGIGGAIAKFLSGSSGQSGSEFDSASSSGDTVYRSASPPDYAYALGPPILSPTAQEERLYFVQSPDSSPAASPQQVSSSSSSSDVSLHFDSADLPVHDHANTQTSAPVDSNFFTNALEDLRSSPSQRIHESTCEIRSKVNDVEFSVRGDLLKQQAWLRQTFQNACDVLERQKKRAQEAKLNALDGKVAAIRNEQLEFQNKISADLLSLSTQFADIIDYIRGGDAKKGEGGSSSRPPPVRVERRPLPIPQSPRDVAGGSSAVRIPTFPRTTGTFAERAEQARRHILESGLAITLEEAAEEFVMQIFRSQIECKEKEIGQGEKTEVVPLKGEEDY
ncbi:hypothetical protein F511_14762 [Dorcoceras hygrometricum]|uniref:Dystroglycan-like n=1 Tax=Dorcoceras hygrometricum TaxID=472368 RepID=A0A2Z7BKI4_9LAMI|nr:hypothetical protein F511_14762 [Dorcoceras hygrometricum]